VRYPGQSMRIELADGDFYDIEMETEADKNGQVSLGAAVIFDSAHGWHNTYRLIDLAASHGMTLGQDDDAAVARYRTDRGGDDFETVHDMADRAEGFLNAQITTEGWSFGWSDGDFLLANEAWWERDG
jgi:hypothetical protein